MEARRKAEKKRALTSILKKIKEIRGEIREFQKEKQEYSELMDEQEAYVIIRPDYKEILKNITKKKMVVIKLRSIFKRITNAVELSTRDRLQICLLTEPV
jgi:hypothetical protein